MVRPGRRIVIVTPNISERMGGEAIKAHQFLCHLVDSGEAVSVITHRRSAEVMAADFPQVETLIVEDSPVQVAIWKSVVLRQMIDTFFFLYARRRVREIISRCPDAVFHYLCPISPILLRFPVKGATNILGPLTGNIYYPPALRAGEPIGHKIGRSFHYLLQRVLGALTDDKQLFRRVLVSGGERTRCSLAWAGCPPSSMRDVVDSGVSAAFTARPLIRHEGVNCRFLTMVRLVPYKGVQLTIEALAHVTQPIRFDVYGDGRYLPHLQRLAADLGVAPMVRFMGWTSHETIIDRIADYRGFVMPSLAEANGIAVQEMMMAGLPVLCLKWGGPAMLADDDSAILIEPASRAEVVRRIAAALDMLATDPDRANALAARARAIAEHRFSWDSVAEEWLNAYELD